MTDPNDDNTVSATIHILADEIDGGIKEAPDMTAEVLPLNPSGNRPASDDEQREWNGQKASGDGPPAPRKRDGLPEGCPIQPLGIEGDRVFLLDEGGQLTELKRREVVRLNILGVFGRRNDLVFTYWPKKNADGNVTGWRTEQAEIAILKGCALQGIWDPFRRVRGAGAWLGDEGELVLHLGDQVMVFPRYRDDGAAVDRPFDARTVIKPGLHGRYVYPAYEEKPQPVPEIQSGGDKGIAAEVLSLLDTWNWSWQAVAPQLLLGWICAAMIGGALKWRPAVWLTGGKGTGKSTLHDLLKDLFSEGLVSVSDTSAAGVWQELGYSTLPVAIDEIEAEDNPSDQAKIRNVIKLARQASSGGVVLRGGADHKSSKFYAQSCFLFSSILVPPLNPQDRSRLAILDLQQLKGGSKPDLSAKRIRALGARLLRRVVDVWPRTMERIEIYQTMLEQEGLSARGADQFGTLLGIADAVLHDHEFTADYAERFTIDLASQVRTAEEDDRDEMAMVTHLMTSSIEPYKGGERHTVASWLARVLRQLNEQEPGWKDGNRKLKSYGLRIKMEKDQIYLAIANNHSGLARLFENTHWAGRAGASNVWVQAAARLPGAIRNKPVRFDTIIKAVLVPIDLLALNDLDETTKAEDLSSDDDAS